MKALGHAAEQAGDPRRDLRFGFRAVGQAGRIRGVDNRCLRQHLADFLQNGQPADTGIEQKDRRGRIGPEYRCLLRRAAYGGCHFRGLINLMLAAC